MIKTEILEIIKSATKRNQSVHGVSAQQHGNLPETGYSCEQNPHYPAIAMAIRDCQDVLRILDLGAGRGTLLRFLMRQEDFKDMKKFFYKGVECDERCKEILMSEGKKALKENPNLDLQTTTKKGDNVFNYFDITKDSEYNIISAQLLLH